MKVRPDPHVVLDRIREATNAHRLDDLTSCFTSDYRSVWPIHPARSFGGVEQVAENWGRMFAAIPDLTTTVLRWVADGDRVWSEWEFTGTRTDGAPHLMRGVIILLARGDQASEATFYLEPVEAAGVDAAVAVDRIVGASSAAEEKR